MRRVFSRFLFFKLFLICLFLLGKSSQIFSQKDIWTGEKKLYYGVAYYPEIWDPGEMEKDIEWMKKANVNVVRIAEFAWAYMEPSEGQYSFEWLHRIIERLNEHSISVVLGTPTATPPAWMAEKYPEMFTMDENGILRQHGGRRNCSYTHPVYREKSRQIVEKMAQEFGRKPGVIAWQTDNEFHPSPDYSDRTKALFHQWLNDKYGNIGNLNKIWATGLWSQYYSSFDQIPLPKSSESHHTSLRFEWSRFSSQQVVDYQQIQIDEIRKYSDLPITHDGMPGQSQNYPELFEKLDFMAVNNYHSFEAYSRIQSNYDRLRGYNKGFHWLFETAPNNSGGGNKGNTWFLHQPDGSLHAAIWMNYAMGGQGTMFWLWRQHPADREMPHGSFINTWGKPVANFDDLSRLGGNIAQMSDFLMNHPVEEAKAAIYYSHENDAGLRIEEYANGLRYYTDWTYRFYRPVSDAFIHRDVIHEGSDIEGYKLLLMPLMPYIPEKNREKLKQWVQEGGILILGPMSGYRTEAWTGFTDYATGDWEEWMDIEVDSRIPVGTKVRDAEIPLMLSYAKDLNWPDSQAGLWAENLSSASGRVLAKYQNGMHKGRNAIIETAVGKGKVVFLGCDPGYKAYKNLVIRYAGEAGISPLAESSDRDVLVVPRKGEKARALFVINLANEEKNISFSGKPSADLFSGEKIEDRNLHLSPYEVKLIKLK